jgi:hypothetical protein
MGIYEYALLENRYRFFGLVKRYNLVGFFSSEDAAKTFANDCLGIERLATNGYTIQRVNRAQKTAMTLSLLGR